MSQGDLPTRPLSFFRMMSDFSDDDSYEYESDLESEDEDVVAEALFYDTDEDESVSSKGERQFDAESSAGEAKIEEEELYLTDSHENDTHIASPADNEHEDVQIIGNHQTKATGQGTRRSTSLLHDDLLAGNCVFFSIDLETGGENCGIVQLSAVAFKLDGTLLGEYNSYVKPPDGSIRNQNAMEVTGLGPRDPRISSAKPLQEVRADFKGVRRDFAAK